MEISFADTVELKDGRIGDVIGIYDDPEGYEIELCPDPDGSETIAVSPSDIKRVIR